jgi:EamA domain-containing membrane protein RarD
VSGYAIWGLSPLFYMLLDFTSALRSCCIAPIWSAPVLLAMLLMAKRWGATLAVLADRKALMVLLLTAILIGANWWALHLRGQFRPGAGSLAGLFHQSADAYRGRRLRPE